MSDYVRPESEWSALCVKHITGLPNFGGGASKTYWGGQKAIGQITAQLGEDFFDSKRIVEIGSGWGRLGMGLLNRDISTYTGVEIIDRCVTFCKMAFAPWPQFQFVHVSLRNTHYNLEGEKAPSDVVYPLADGSADLVMLSSVFTHVESVPAVERMLSEIHRILRPGGQIYCTWLKKEMYPVGNGAAMVVRPESEIRAFLDKEFEWDTDWLEGVGHTRRQWKILATRKE